MLRSISSILLLTFLATTSSAQTKLEKRVGPKTEDPGGRCDTTAWHLVFHDEFDGTTLDRSKWVTYSPVSSDGSDQCTACRYMSGTNSLFMDDQVVVSDGLLHLGVEATETTWFGKTTEHKAAMIRSIGSAEFTYGKFEIRCKLPEGDGLWPAFWMFGGETEIDVFEVCGEKPEWIKGSLHRWGKPKFSNTGKYKGEDSGAGFHFYAVEWEPDEIRWYMDGELIYSRGRFVDAKGKPLPGCDREVGPHHVAPYFPRAVDKVNVIAGNGVSSYKGFCKGPKSPKPWLTGSSMEVDWIRVYQRNPQQGLEDLCGRARRIAVSPDHSLHTGDQALIRVDGPHGSLEWIAGSGLSIIETNADGVSVSANGTNGPTWVIAYCNDDPCTDRPTSFELQVNVVP
ncbi:MAG: glycoside hydrolase family 16 protein [Flavobacteriales bacterium]|nr:glycoside hydrolase family 16 protein [Flavobacteriales bacterium]